MTQQPSNTFYPPDDKSPVKMIVVLKDGSRQEFDEFLFVAGGEFDKKGAYATQFAFHFPREQKQKVAPFLSSLSMLTLNFLHFNGIQPGQKPRGMSDESPT